MTEYRRANTAGATWFFTVNLAERHGNRLLVDNIDLLRQVFRKVKQDHPFEIDAFVLLPEHLHCIWTLPDGDSDYKTRWALIKAGFSRRIPTGERRSESRVKRGERGIWQRRYWEHLIRTKSRVRSSIDASAGLAYATEHGQTPTPRVFRCSLPRDRSRRSTRGDLRGR